MINKEYTGNVRAYKNNVLARIREDLNPTLSDIQIGSTNRKILLAEGWKSALDNIQVIEVISTGSEVTCIEPGQFSLVDKSDNLREISVNKETIYFYSDKDIHCQYIPDNNLEPHNRITPLPNHLLTKEAPERMREAVLGTSENSKLLHIPDYLLSMGFPSKWTNNRQLIAKSEKLLGLPPNYRQRLGLPAPQEGKEYPLLHTNYQEVVRLGDNCSEYGIQIGDLIPVTVERSEWRIRIGSNHYSLVNIDLDSICKIGS